MTVRILVGDVRERLADLPDESIHCVVSVRAKAPPDEVAIEVFPPERMYGYVKELVRVKRALISWQEKHSALHEIPAPPSHELKPSPA